MNKWTLLPLLLVSGTAFAQSPATNVTRDGRWLKAGIQQYETVQAGAKDQNVNETIGDAAGAALFFGYVRGVIDVEMFLTLKARTLTEGANRARDEKRASREWAKGSNEGMYILNPLEKSSFLDQRYQADQYIQMIKNYLEKHPEQWDKDAAILIEFALLEAFPRKKE